VNCGYPGFKGPNGIAIDSTGNAWVGNQLGNTLTGITAAGKQLSTPGGFPGAGLNSPTAVAIDASGDIWLSNSAGSTVTEFVALATPVLTPAASCLMLNNGHAVCLP
jgi:hypothetical protein